MVDEDEIEIRDQNDNAMFRVCFSIKTFSISCNYFVFESKTVSDNTFVMARDVFDTLNSLFLLSEEEIKEYEGKAKLHKYQDISGEIKKISFLEIIQNEFPNRKTPEERSNSEFGIYGECEELHFTINIFIDNGKLVIDWVNFHKAYIVEDMIKDAYKIIKKLNSYAWLNDKEKEQTND